MANIDKALHFADETREGFTYCGLPVARLHLIEGDWVRLAVVNCEGEKDHAYAVRASVTSPLCGLCADNADIRDRADAYQAKVRAEDSPEKRAADEALFARL